MRRTRVLHLSAAWVGAAFFLTLFLLMFQVRTAASDVDAADGAVRELQADFGEGEPTEQSAPMIAFTKTVGTSPMGCAPTDTINVVGPTTVIYCYAVKNTGDVTFTRHSLIEGGLGTLLNDVFLRLPPGQSTFFTLTTFVTQTAVTTAAWQAYDVASYTVDDTAPYNFIDISSTGTPLVLGPNGAINVTTGFNIQIYNRNNHHHRVGMNGAVKFNSNFGSINAVNDPIPTNDFVAAMMPFWDDLDNDSGGVFHQESGSPPNRRWIVQWNNVPHDDNVGAITFQTVMTEGVNSILFQYADVEFGVPAWDGGGSATIGLQKNRFTGVTYSFNTATLTNNMAIRFDPVLVTAADSHTATVNVTPLTPNIALTKTVGTVAGVCPTTDSIVVPEDGGEVFYCYEVRNTGNITLSLHDLNDDKLGPIFSNFAYDLGPGQSVDTVSAGLVISQFITQNTVNVGTWTAYNAGPSDVVTATDTATVTLTPAPGIDLVKTAGLSPGQCAASSTVVAPIGGGTVYYCYEVTNTGNVPLSLHSLFDDDLGAVFDDLPYDLGPGESVDTVSAGLIISKFVSQDTVNTGTWTAYNPGPTDVVTATATATVTLDTLYRQYVPVVVKAGTTAAGLPGWLLPLAAAIPVFGLVVVGRPFARKIR